MEEYLEGEVPSKVAFFVWTMANGRILTTDNLSMWRMCVVDGCCMFEEWDRRLALKYEDVIFTHSI